MTAYDAWIESEPPEDKDALIDALEREVKWLRELIADAEAGGVTVCLRVEEIGCPWCGAGVDFDNLEKCKRHADDCEAFTPDGKVRSKFL